MVVEKQVFDLVSASGLQSGPATIWEPFGEGLAAPSRVAGADEAHCGEGVGGERNRRVFDLAPAARAHSETEPRRLGLAAQVPGPATPKRWWLRPLSPAGTGVSAGSSPSKFAWAAHNEF